MKKAAKSKVVGKPAHHAKPAAPKKAKKHAAGAASKKHALTAHQKHLAHLAHLKHIGKALPVKRGLALGDAVACCAAEALAASLRLSGLSVGDEDVLTLYRHTADGPDAGASIVATLNAAAVYGLAGVRPASFRYENPITGYPALILGVGLPGPHTVLATPDGWWSWGELHDPAAFPDAVVEEAWWVAWR